MRMLSESKVSGVNQGNDGGGSESKIFLYYLKGLGTSHQSFRKRGDIFNVNGLFISD